MLTAFKVFIRVIFLLAYGAFLYASIHHIAYFYYNFEQDGNSWVGSYMLAIAIDATSLVLAVGVMFFRKGMPRHALVGTWLFILFLTAFSLLVNWEYAIQFQRDGLNKATDFLWINPILASSFALLNVAYSVVAEFFNSKPESAEELQKKLDELKQISVIKQELATLKNQHNSSLIAGKIQMFKDAFSQQNTPAILEQSPDESVANVQEDMSEITEESVSNLPENEDEIEQEEESESLPHLGMIEQAMYDAFMQHPEETEGLIRLSQEQSLDQFVVTLQRKYSQYASYITPKRVANVMGFIAQNPVKKVAVISAVPQVTKPSQYFMTFEEAVRYTGYAEVTLRKQLKAGEIEANKNGDKLKVSTLRIRTGHTAQMPALKAVKFEQEPYAMNGSH